MIDIVVDKPKYSVIEKYPGNYFVESSTKLYGRFESIHDMRKYMNLLEPDFDRALPYGNMERNWQIIPFAGNGDIA